MVVSVIKNLIRLFIVIRINSDKFESLSCCWSIRFSVIPVPDNDSLFVIKHFSHQFPVVFIIFVTEIVLCTYCVCVIF